MAETEHDVQNIGSGYDGTNISELQQSIGERGKGGSGNAKDNFFIVSYLTLALSYRFGIFCALRFFHLVCRKVR
jgi:hypothetical protein